MLVSTNDMGLESEHDAIERLAEKLGNICRLKEGENVEVIEGDEAAMSGPYNYLLTLLSSYAREIRT